MKKTLIFFFFFMGYLSDVNAQVVPSVRDSIALCDIIDTNIKIEVQEYIKRNIKTDKEKGIVVVKLSDSKDHKTNYEFYISEILMNSVFKVTKPVGYSIISGRPILLYGFWNADMCKKNSNKSYLNIFEKYLINDDLQESDEKKHEKTYLLFDPEILKIVVKNNSIILKEELSRSLDLN